MTDEWQTRKDIETLFNLVYARTSDSPVAQKSELDDYKTYVTDNYLTNQVFDDVNNHWDDWNTVYDDGEVIFENSRNRCRLRINKENVSVTENWTSLLDLSDYYSLMPPQDYVSMGDNLIAYGVLNTATDVYELQIKGYGTTGSQDIIHTIEWSI